MSSHSLIQAVEVMDDLKIAFHRATRVQDRARSTHQRVATEVERSAEPCGLGVSRTWEQKNEYLLSLNSTLPRTAPETRTRRLYADNKLDYSYGSHGDSRSLERQIQAEDRGRWRQHSDFSSGDIFIWS